MNVNIMGVCVCTIPMIVVVCSWYRVGYDMSAWGTDASWSLGIFT